MNTNEEPEYYVTRVTKDTYEAAYYFKYGATVTHVRTTPVHQSKISRRGYAEQWTIHLTNVPASRVLLWEMDRAIEKVSDIANARKRLKKEVKRHLHRLI